jgi:hypothetical protein
MPLVESTLRRELSMKAVRISKATLVPAPRVGIAGFWIAVVRLAPRHGVREWCLAPFPSTFGYQRLEELVRFFDSRKCGS